MNAIELVKEQHRKVESLFERFEKAKRAEDKQEIFLEIAARLVGHDAIEREIFYPACERVLGRSEPLMEGIAEHGLVEFSIFRADKARGKDSFDYLVTVLKEMVEHHVEEEEREILSKVAQKLSKGQLERLGAAMSKRFSESMALDFRAPLRSNLQQVLGGRTETTPPKRAARTAVRKRTARGATRVQVGTVRAKKRGARSKDSARA